MNNTFYNNFDTQTFHDKSPNDYRTPFQIDRDRIIHSFAFRRLQAKTQVFFSGEYDFYRTRLTHSIEVAQIGRSICNYLHHSSEYLNDEFYIDPDLVEAACLSHDLGHPPFGHAGEKKLNLLMQPFGGFEGNAQTLRILTETIYSSHGERKGMQPTRAFTDSILKYKVLYTNSVKKDNHFIYDDQQQVLDFVFDRQPFPPEIPNPNKFRSVECQIMDWSDDTSYSLNDMVDSIKTGFMTLEKIEKWQNQHKELFENDDQHVQILNNVKDIIRSGSVESRFAMKIGEFINACSLVESQTFMSEKTNRYRYELVIDPRIQKECNLYKKMSKDIVFDSAQISQLELKGHYMLERVFNVLIENYINRSSDFILLPMDMENVLKDGKTDDKTKMRMLCDYIAGMSDRYAVRFYRRLFEPDFGSIVDLV